MARAYTKCSKCKDIIWFSETDKIPQAVQCLCNATKLTEDGPEGSYEELTQEEIDSLA